MIDFLKKLFKIKTDLLHETKESRHYRDLIPGPKIYLDGKPYVKVQLRFVDTLSYDITKHLDQLETEIEFQKVEIERLTSVTDHFEKKINELQTLNINLQNENRRNSNKLFKNISDLTLEKEKSELNVFDLDKNCQNLNKTIEDLKGQLKKMRITIVSKDNRIASLEQDIHRLESKGKEGISIKKVVLRLRKDLQAAEHDRDSKKNEIEMKDKFIATVTQKIFEKEAKINELEKILNPNKKQ